MTRLLLALFFVLTAFPSVSAFDHTPFTRLLSTHVKWIRGGVASRVDYAGFQKDRAALDEYLTDLSAVPEARFQTWSKNARLAFLINAYNAFTIELVLTDYPDLSSIKDLGGWFQSPWEKEFFTLFGEKRHLDYIEHERIRKKGVYDEPRIHFAVVCASIGCPALRDEAFTADRIDRQLADSTKRFLSDSTRNRYNPETGTLEVSRIFKWYGEDFTRKHGSVPAFLAEYADQLAKTDAGRERVREQTAKIDYLPYDWKLNDLRR